MDPHCNGLNGKLENVQKRAARFMTRNYSRETGRMTGIFEELKWEILQLTYRCTCTTHTDRSIRIIGIDLSHIGVPVPHIRIDLSALLG